MRLHPSLIVGFCIGVVLSAACLLIGLSVWPKPKPEPGLFEGRISGQRISLPPRVFGVVDKGLHRNGRVIFARDGGLK